MGIEQCVQKNSVGIFVA